MLNFLLQAEGGAASGGGGLQSMLLLVGIIVIFYFFLIRPQQKRNKEQKNFRNELKKGQKVVTIGGIHGKIVDVQETTVTIEVEGQMHLKMEKTAIAADASAQTTNQDK